MSFGTRVAFEAVREAAFGVIGANYATLGAITADYCRIISIYNSSDADVYISTDGVTNHFRIAAGSGMVFDFTTNEAQNAGFFLPLRTQFYQKRVSGAPTTGAVWIHTVYAQGGV